MGQPIGFQYQKFIATTAKYGRTKFFNLFLALEFFKRTLTVLAISIKMEILFPTLKQIITAILSLQRQRKSICKSMFSIIIASLFLQIFSMVFFKELTSSRDSC